jgi:dimethylargininase
MTMDGPYPATRSEFERMGSTMNQLHSQQTTTRAIVRRPSRRIADGEVTHIDRIPMDVDLAMTQYEQYLQTLQSLGVELIFADESPDHPDGLFVEDALFMVGDVGVLTRPGAPSRTGEVESIAELIRALSITSVSIPAPHTLDGGDVLVVGKHIFVGVSTRTTMGAIDSLRVLIASTGFQVVPVTVTGCLHLKTAITRLPDDSLIAVAAFVDTSVFTLHGFRVHETAEETGGDVLCIGNIVVLPLNAPATAQQIASLGFDVRPIDVSELQKIEAGVTCMSVLLPTQNN